jgi:hypothetical protein
VRFAQTANGVSLWYLRRRNCRGVIEPQALEAGALPSPTRRRAGDLGFIAYDPEAVCPLLNP